jgi:hypothetical protein
LLVAVFALMSLQGTGQDYLLGQWEGLLDYPGWITQPNDLGKAAAADELPIFKLHITFRQDGVAGKRMSLEKIEAVEAPEGSREMIIGMFSHLFNGSGDILVLRRSDPRIGIELGPSRTYGLESSRGSATMIEMFGPPLSSESASISKLNARFQRIDEANVVMAVLLAEYNNRLIFTAYLTRKN